MRGTLRCLALLLLTTVSAVALLSGVDGRSDGTQITAREGCTCHAAQPSDFATIELAGLPERYEGGKRYSLTVTVQAPVQPLPVAQNAGGFALEANAGRFEAPAGATDVQVTGAIASHAEAGNDQRTWKVDWIAPAQGGDVTFAAAANAVNGNGQSDPVDLWQRTEVSVSGSLAPSAQPPGNATGNASGNSSSPPPPPPANTPGAPLVAVGAVVLLVGAAARSGAKR